VILLAAYASRTENQDAIDASVVQACGDPSRARAGIKLLDFKPFNPTDKRTEITYREEATGEYSLSDSSSPWRDFVVTSSSSSLPRMTSCAFPFLGSYFFVSVASRRRLLSHSIFARYPSRSLANARSPQANSSASPRA
jgi:hypothetical protein